MHEEGRRAGARQRRGDFAADVSRLAHAGDDHAPLTGEDQPAGIGELSVHVRCQCLQRIGFELDHFASQLLE